MIESYGMTLCACPAENLCEACCGRELTAKRGSLLMRSAGACRISSVATGELDCALDGS